MNRLWTVHEIAWPADPAAAATAYAGTGEFAWLDSAAGDDLRTPPARYSMFCGAPVARLEQHDGRRAEFSIGPRLVATDASAWRLWRRALQRLPLWPLTCWRLSPGWVGYVGFEMARKLEKLPASHGEDLGLPLLRLALYDRGIVLDHQARRAYAVAASGLRPRLDLPGVPLQALDERWQAAATPASSQQPAHPTRLCFEMERAEYERIVRRAIEYIAAGDIYQVNLAQRLRFVGVTDVLAAYCRLRRVNPAPYAALLRWPGKAIGSVSPELFLRVRGRSVLTRPIKGTRPRTREPQLDAAYRDQLLRSEKDAAELAMIVDLHRNDLGRVCELGSVRVRHARRLETHPTVFHTVADVVGRLAADRDPLDLLAACFPAGSISGVPKIRSLEIIDELEPVARGAYTGAVGVLGLDGQMTFNVAIRTLQFRRSTATLYVGGGIVADSDPAEEYDETLAKARGIVSALTGVTEEAEVANGESRTVAASGTRVG
jgi:para-aminobenzoate synthetase component 1